ncbi:hypothetical protein D3C79_888590 [compost metagenome]
MLLHPYKQLKPCFLWHFNVADENINSVLTENLLGHWNTVSLMHLHKAKLLPWNTCPYAAHRMPLVIDY